MQGFAAELADHAHTFIFEQLAKRKAEQSECPLHITGGRIDRPPFLGLSPPESRTAAAHFICTTTFPLARPFSR